jgi:hypothetical protein
MGQEVVDYGHGPQLILRKESGLSTQFFWHVRCIPNGHFDPSDTPIRLRTEDACWPWPGTRNTAGYGVVSWLGWPFMAHRIAFELANGPLEDGEIICHRCDNPPCCNPLHLYAGTHKDNARDRWERTGHRRKPRTTTHTEE